LFSVLDCGFIATSQARASSLKEINPLQPSLLGGSWPDQAGEGSRRLRG
jgi:hypothetical protein